MSKPNVTNKNYKKEIHLNSDYILLELRQTNQNV